MIRRTTRLAIVLAVFLLPVNLACQTDDGLFDRQEGPAEEMGEEIDQAREEIEDALER